MSKVEKLYLVLHRKFTNEDLMKTYLLKMSAESRKRVQIKVYTLEAEISGDFIDAEIVQNKRDLQLKSILEGSQLTQIMESIRVKVETQRPQERYYNWEGDIILKKLSIVQDEKGLSKTVGDHGSFLFKIEKSVEWYKTLLRARSFYWIPSGTFKKVWDTTTRKYVTINAEQELEYFKLAKEEIKNEKKRNKKTVFPTN